MPISLPTSTSVATTRNYNMLNDGVNNYWFHHKPSFPGANPVLYEDILSNATIAIDVWDPYFHAAKDPIIFKNVQSNIFIKILSRIGLNSTSVSYLTDVRREVQFVIPNSKNVSFCIGVVDIARNKDWDFHDRFLIIDNQDVYLIGASVEYNHKSIKSSGIYKITNDTTKNFIIAQFNTHWLQTVKNPPSMQFLHP